MAAVTQTITRTIVGINPIGNNIWQIEFNPAQTQVTSNSVTSPVIYYSSSALPVILNPYLNNIGNWNTNDYNVLINNADIDRLSTLYQQVDYTTAQAIPINFQQIISGTAYPAAIQDSNYTSYQYSGIRYLGSKNTTDNFNVTSVSQSLAVQNYQNSNIGATTLGYPSVNNYDASILEFNWGGGTYPEIYGGGALSLNQLLNVGLTKDSVTKFSSTEPGFTASAEILFPVNSLPVFNQYTTTAGTTVNARVSSIGITVPSVSNYMIASANPSTTAFIPSGSNYIVFNDSVNEVNTNSSGNYVTGSSITYTQLFSNISTGFSEGERWFVTMYNSLPYTIQGVLNPYNFNYNGYTIENGYEYPLPSKGVFEITSLSNTPVLPTSSYQAKFGSSANNGQIAINSATNSGSLASSVTYFDIAVIDQNGDNRASILANLSVGQVLKVENMNTTFPFDPSIIYEGPFQYTISASPTNYGTYYRVPVTWVSSTNGTNIRLANNLSNFFYYQIYTNGNSNLYFSLPGSGSFPTTASFGNNNLGLLIWKSQQGAYMLFNDATLSGVGKGGLVTSTPSPVIQQDFTYITQTFGNNPKNQ